MRSKSIKLILAGLCLIAGIGSLLYVGDSIVYVVEESLADEPVPITVDVDAPDPAHNGRLVFITGRLHGQGAVLRDPVFPFSAEAVELTRSVEVYYTRRQILMHTTSNGPTMTRHVSGGGGSMILEERNHSAFGSDYEDEEEEPPPFVQEIQAAIPAQSIAPAQIRIGQYVLHPDAVYSGVFGKTKEPEFREAELQAFVQSDAGAPLRALFERFGFKGIAVDVDYDSYLILYRESPEEHVDGDVRLSFSAMLPQYVGLVGIQKPGPDPQTFRVVGYSPEEDPAIQAMDEHYLNIQFGEYETYEEYIQDPMYDFINREDLEIFSAAGVTLLLIGLGLFFSARREST